MECSSNVMDGSSMTVVPSGSSETEIDVLESECGNSVVDVSYVNMVESEDSRNEPIDIVQVTEQQQYQIIKIHRLNVKQDMIDAFKDPSIMDRNLTFVFIDGRGNEEKGSGIGVVRDALSLFWKEVYDSLLIGENERVPFIRHNYNRLDWEAVARVVLKGYRMCEYLPPNVFDILISGAGCTKSI